MNILHLEDNEVDAEFFHMLLAKELPECRIDRTDSRNEYEAALQMENYDLILSDYSMPGFNGLAALEIARTSAPDTPFIFLSGTIGEERAIEALKRGAVDYVLKNSPNRLVNAVRAAILSAERDAARRRAEETLRATRERFREIAETIDDFIVVVDEAGNCLYTNPAFLGMTEQVELDRDFRLFDSVHPEDVAMLRTAIANAEDDVTHEIRYRLLKRDGSIRFVEATLSRPKTRNRDTPRTVLIAGRDVTLRTQAEERLKEQASLIEKARDAIWLMDLNFTITQWNAGAERIYGRTADEAIGCDARTLLFPHHIGQFNTAVALAMAHGEWQGEFRFQLPDNRELIADSSWSLVYDSRNRPKSILCINTDVTHRRHLEFELQRAQRIESLGMLASGIAHDLNNVLSPILMSTVILRPLATRKEDQIILDTVEASAVHGTDLINQILLFARGEEGRRFEVHMGKLLESLQTFLKTVLGKAIELHLAYDRDLWVTSADVTQIKQVIVNLCSNARDAMPAGGSIRITATNARIDASTADSVRKGIAEGSYVKLSVSDSGSGIPPETLEHIFEPFFTTKGTGKGTGLGLSNISNIIQSHGGEIDVKSDLGRGTTFHIYLPAAAPSREVARPIALSAPPRGNGEVILVIDDDEGIRTVAEKILLTHGYEVITAEDGEGGLAEFALRSHNIRVVLCDQMMPGLGGDEVLNQIHALNGEVGLILMGGLVEQSEEWNHPAEPRITCLPKPLTIDTLLRSIHAGLQEHSCHVSE